MFACFLLSGRRDWASLLGSRLLGRGLASPRSRWLGYVGNQGSLKNSNSHIDASHSRQPLVKGERLVRYEVNAVMLLPSWTTSIISASPTTRPLFCKFGPTAREGVRAFASTWRVQLHCWEYPFSYCLSRGWVMECSRAC